MPGGFPNCQLQERSSETGMALATPSFRFVNYTRSSRLRRLSRPTPAGPVPAPLRPALMGSMPTRNRS
jgi:hypothetical protein